MKEFIISEKDSSQRIDKYIKKVLNEAPLSFIYRLFRVKDIKVNNKRVDISYILNEGDIVKVYVSDAKLEEFSKKKTVIPVSDFDLDIVYEDENILIVNKPRGILIHGDENETRMTLSNVVLNYLVKKGEYDPTLDKGFIPSPAHRLDRNTSGLVLFGKNMVSLQELFEIIKEKECIEKHYLALLNGNLKKDGVIDLPLKKDEKTGKVTVTSLKNGGKTALTKYSIKANYNDYTLVDAHLITGRTHQLRVHFASLNHPIVGDSKYGNFVINKEFEKRYKFHNQFLHAYKLEFKKVIGKLSYLSNKTFECKLPSEEENIINKIKED